MKVLFVHGLASSGAFRTAGALKNLLRPCTVISPDLPFDPDEALSLLRSICDGEHPDLIVGHSLGGFLAQQIRGFRKVLINPSFHTAEFMRHRMKGKVEYLNVRQNGETSFFITDELCDRYAALELTQFDSLDDAEIARTMGLFALEDEVVKCGREFEQRFPGRSVSYHGTHLPCYRDIKEVLVPALPKFFPDFTEVLSRDRL